jgi:hypothetical protein
MRWWFSLLAILGVVGRLTCKNDSNMDADFWFLLKGPKGTAYMYADGDGRLTPSSGDLNRTGALNYTVSQLWNASTDYILFNDEPVGVVANSSTGHTKGIWMWNMDSGLGVILTHSVPLYPAGPSHVPFYTGLGHNAYTYAQHMACFSTTVSDMNRLAVLGQLTVAGIYDTRISSGSPSGLVAFGTGVVNPAGVCNVTIFILGNGTIVRYFAKSSQWNNELYAMCIAPHLASALVTETWIRGSATGPYCGSYPVLDVSLVNFSVGFAWKETQDHSKWAIGLDGGWICPSDINRMTTQYARGGSAFCFKNPILMQMLYDAIVSTDTCA